MAVTKSTCWKQHRQLGLLMCHNRTVLSMDEDRMKWFCTEGSVERGRLRGDTLGLRQKWQQGWERIAECIGTTSKQVLQQGSWITALPTTTRVAENGIQDVKSLFSRP